jgi:hypothetical protein
MGFRQNKTRAEQKQFPPKNSKCLSSILQNVLLTAAAVPHFYASSNYSYLGHAIKHNKARLWLQQTNGKVHPITCHYGTEGQ